MSHVLSTELAELPFQDQGALRCVIVPDPKGVSIDDVIRSVGESQALIDNSDDEAGDDEFVVRIGGGPQEALSYDALFSRLRAVP